MDARKDENGNSNLNKQLIKILSKHSYFNLKDLQVVVKTFLVTVVVSQRALM